MWPASGRRGRNNKNFEIRALPVSLPKRGRQQVRGDVGRIVSLPLARVMLVVARNDRRRDSAYECCKGGCRGVIAGKSLTKGGHQPAAREGVKLLVKLDLAERPFQGLAVAGAVNPQRGNAGEVAPAVRPGKEMVYSALGRRKHISHYWVSWVSRIGRRGLG